ncbi:hypothetical protein [uncultured Nostoc sp.]|uniref:hypothetical protein n=1 Tax=uncultured Nostoc sp. TaxID=340711 RepID=UPI0035CA4358
MIVLGDNAIASIYNAIASTDNAIASIYNAIVSPDNAIASAYIIYSSFHVFKPHS